MIESSAELAVDNRRAPPGRLAQRVWRTSLFRFLS